jgi:hypothetical protein
MDMAWDHGHSETINSGAVDGTMPLQHSAATIHKTTIQESHPHNSETERIERRHKATDIDG